MDLPSEPHRAPHPAEPPAERAPEALLADVALGDEDAFELLYARIAGPVFGLAVRILRDRDLAQDVAQEVLGEVWRLAARFDPERGTAMGWVLTMAHRRAVDRVRREEVRTATISKEAATWVAADHDVVVDTLERQWDAALVRRAMGTLTTIQREAIELAFFRGYTHQQVSAALDVPLGTAKTRIRDGLIRLRDAMGVEQ
ncbi:sigma-70 family RNA polymerase sigma factor [Actinotalea sp.]|uniref:sigma-70 family RNA polymerase sigma factor n=1 Tax=Actinotalea sp. TaxID=1872145 RepID=UPI0035686151